jgi:hypothetical protein
VSSVIERLCERVVEGVCESFIERVLEVSSRVWTASRVEYGWRRLVEVGVMSSGERERRNVRV